MLAASVGGCAVAPREAATYVNPVLGRDFPDPAALRAPDGWTYAYATQGAEAGRMLNIQVARSRDLVEWHALGDALAQKPRWAAGKQKFWAPHVIYDAAQARYIMYYSAEPDGSEGKCLAVALAEAPAGPFLDAGAPLLCGEGLEDIDPMAFDDPASGKRLLYWGSGGKPIRVRELAPDRLSFMPGSSAIDVLAADPAAPYESLIEGAWVIFRRGTYYLFYSGDRCCAREPRYALMVARASDALGPFEKRGVPVLEGNARWRAPGHNSIVTDEDGGDWILYHAIDAASADRARVMLLDRIIYREGWPGVENSQPSVGVRRAPLLRMLGGRGP